MAELLWFAAGILCLWVLFQHIVGPLFVYRINRSPHRYDLVVVDWEPFIAARSATFTLLHEQLSHLGFSKIFAAPLTFSPHDVMYFVLYRSRTDPCIATLMSANNASGETVVLEFTQRYDNGVNLSLSNAPLPSVYPKWRRRELYRLPAIHDAGLLFQKFIRIRAKSRHHTPVHLPEGREIEVVQDYLNEELAELISKGFIAPNVINGQRRYTLKGAYMMSWKLLWPWKQLINFSSTSHAEALSKD